MNYKKEITNHYKCRICNSSKIVDLIKFRKTPIEDNYIKKINKKLKQKIYPLTLSICKNCLYVHLRHTIDPYLSYQKYLYKTSTTSGLSSHYDKNALKDIKKFKLNKNSIVLDIGSNDGSMLNSFKKNKIKVLGVEPAKNIAIFANKNKIETINSYFDDACAVKIKKKFGLINFITANYMLANVLNLNQFFNNINKILDPNGIFLIETGYHPTQFKIFMFDYIYHEHFSYFTISFFTKFLQKFNLFIYDLAETAPKGGSIKIYIKKMSNNSKPKKIVNYFVNNEKKQKINSISYYRKFNKSILVKKNQIIKLLEKLKNNNNIIVGIGASHSVTTLIYNFELRKYLSYLVDDNQIKHNTYSPGYNIPVYSTKKIYMNAQKPEYIIILGWQHQNTILKKHNNLLKKGIKFIIPLPELKIIE